MCESVADIEVVHNYEEGVPVTCIEVCTGVQIWVVGRKRAYQAVEVQLTFVEGFEQPVVGGHVHFPGVEAGKGVVLASLDAPFPIPVDVSERLAQQQEE